MDSAIMSTNESTESDVGHGEDDSHDSPDYGLEMDPASAELAVDAMPVSFMTPEPADPQADDRAVDPHIGMEFDSLEDAWMLYNAYARRTGFNTRISVYQRSRRDGSITARQFVCAREGFRTPRRKNGGESQARRTRAVTRVGCKAMIRVKKLDDGRWVVSRLEKAHNHELEAPSNAHCIRSLRLLSESARNLSGTRAARYTKQEGMRCNGVDEKSGDGRGGMQGIIDYLKRMQAEDSGFFLAVQYDGDRCTGNVFWADARSRMAYRHFGDVVMLDMAYKTNQYQIPLAFFSGVNCHCQPVLFGCALLVDDSESSLVWLFKAMLSAVSGRHPTSIISEHDKVIESAITQVFPRTRNRLCKWHVLKEIQDKLSDVCHAYPSFQEEFHNCVNMAVTVGEFESHWATLISSFDLRDNEWLQSVYSCRHQWVPVYLRNTFFAEISTVEQCDSRTSYFDGHIDSVTNLHTFIQQYEKALDTRYEKEVQADFDTIYSLPALKTPSPLEKQAAETYTKRVFMKFQEELMETFSCTAKKIDEEGEISTYRVAKCDEESKACTVMFSAPEIKASCSCQMFEYAGILCRHILTVFSIASVLMLPSHYILKRWTKNAKDEGVSTVKGEIESCEAIIQSQSICQDSQQSLNWRYNSLCREAIKYAEDGSTSIDIFIVAMHALQEAKNKVNMAKRNVGKSAQPGVFHNGTQALKEKDLQKLCILEEIRAKGLNEGRLMASDEMRREIAPQEAKQILASQKGVLFPQQPCKFALVTHGLSNGSGSSNLLTATTPLALNMPNGQTLYTQSDDPKLVCLTQSMTIPFPLQLLPSMISTGSLDGNEPVLVSLPIRSIAEGEPKPGETPSQPSQIQNTVGVGQAIVNPDGAANMSDSSEPKLVAVPMAYLVPFMSNLPTPSSALTNLNTPVGSQEAHQPVAAAQAAKPIAAQESQTTVKESSRSSMVPVNPIRAAAIAAGARIASPSVAASLIKAAQSKNAIHIKVEGSPLTRSPSGGIGQTSTPDSWSAGLMSPSSRNRGTIENAHVAVVRNWVDVGGAGGEDQLPEERGLDFMDSEDDEDMSDADVGGDEIVG